MTRTASLATITRGCALASKIMTPVEARRATVVRRLQTRTKRDTDFTGVSILRKQAIPRSVTVLPCYYPPPSPAICLTVL